LNGQKSLKWLIPAFLFIAAMLIILDQTVRYGAVWDWEQVLHHENFALILISIALGMLLSQKILDENEKNRKQGEQ